jgi:hypothetical protein
MKAGYPGMLGNLRLRNPLRDFLNSQTKLSRDEKFDGRTLSAVSDIMRNTRHIVALHSTLIAFSATDMSRSKWFQGTL